MRSPSSPSPARPPTSAPSPADIVVFGDPMPDDALGIVLQGLAFVLVIVASALLPAPVRAAARTSGSPSPAAA